MATIKKTEHNSYKAIVRRQDLNGKLFKKTKTFKLKTQALRWASNIEDDLIAGRLTVQVTSNCEKTNYDTTLGDLLTAYEEIEVPERKSSSQIRRKIRYLEKAYIDLWETPLGAVSVETLDNFKRERTKNGASSSTVRLDLLLISSAFRISKKLGFGVLQNPVRDKNFELPEANKSRDRAFEENIGEVGEEQAVLDAIEIHPNPDFRCMVKLGILTTLRKSNLSLLRKSQVNIIGEKKLIIIPGHESKNDTDILIPITDEIKTVIEQYYKEKEDYYLVKISKGKEELDKFSSHNSTRAKKKLKKIERAEKELENWKASDKFFTLSKSGLDSAWKRFRAELQEKGYLHNFRWHDLRRVGISKLFALGLTIPQVASISSHKTWAMLRVYTNLKNSIDLAEAINNKLKEDNRPGLLNHRK